MDIETIYRKYFHDVFLYIRTLSGNESLAEEIAQETFVKAMKNLYRFDGRKNIRAWLFTIARNTYFRYCRRNKQYVEEEVLNTIPEASPQILDQLIMNETVERIRQNASLLPTPYREVFHLRIYGNLPFEQIGKSYGKSAGWARVTYYRARQIIQKQIEQEEHTHGKN